MGASERSEQDQSCSAPKPAGGLVLPFGPKFAGVWKMWETHRSQKGSKGKLTPTAIKMQLKKLEPLGESNAIACIGLSIERNWSGLFPEHFESAEKPKKSKVEMDAYYRSQLPPAPEDEYTTPPPSEEEKEKAAAYFASLRASIPHSPE